MPWLDEHFEKMSLCSVFWRRGNAVIRLKPAMDAISSSQMVPPKPSTHRWHNKADLAEHYTACRSAYEAALTDAIEDRHGITTRTTFKEVKRIMQSEEFWASCATTAALMRPLKVCIKKHESLGIGMSDSWTYLKELEEAVDALAADGAIPLNGLHKFTKREISEFKGCIARVRVNARGWRCASCN